MYAGAMSESLVNGKVDGEKALALLKGPEASDDFSKVRELLKILTGLTRNGREFAAALAENNDRLWQRAGTLVEKHAQTIVEVSKDWRQLLGGREEMKLTKDEVEVIPSVAAIQAASET